MPAAGLRQKDRRGYHIVGDEARAADYATPAGCAAAVRRRSATAVTAQSRRPPGHRENVSDGGPRPPRECLRASASCAGARDACNRRKQSEQHRRKDREANQRRRHSRVNLDVVRERKVEIEIELQQANAAKGQRQSDGRTGQAPAPGSRSGTAEPGELRAAPIALRMAISRRRPEVRDSSRLATLAQAISHTASTANCNASSAGRTLPVSDLAVALHHHALVEFKRGIGVRDVGSGSR